MKQPLLKAIILILVVTLLFGELPAPLPAPTVAQAQGTPVNAVVALFNIIGAARRRNRVYREARATQREMDAYYDELLGEARSQLQERGLMGDGTGFTLENRSQLRVYIKMYEALEREREAVTQQIEREKNDARRQFNRSLTNEVVGILIKSPGGQRLIGDMRGALGEMRAAVESIREAIESNRPFDALVAALQEKIERVPVIRHAAQELGSVVAQKIDRLLGGVVTRMEGIVDNVQGGMGDALDQINQLDSELARVDERERTPVSLVEEGGVLSNIRGVDRANAVADVAAQAYTNAAVIAGALRNPTEDQKSTMRDRIREQLLADRLDRLSSFGSRTRYVDCQGVSQAVYNQAMSQLGRTPEIPQDPATSAYLVCRDKNSGAIVHAALIGPPLGASATQTAEAMAEEGEDEESPTETTEAPPLEDRCSLSGNGDFVLENYTVTGGSSNCEDFAYPADAIGDPLLLYMAALGRWVVVAETPAGTEWEWQATEDLEGLIVGGSAITVGTTLEVNASITSPPSEASRLPLPASGNGYALAAMVPLLPLAALMSSRRRRRWLMLLMTVMAFLLMAQSCTTYGTFSGSYAFPLPEDGFPCEVPPDNPNLAEMPGSSGQVYLELTIVDEDSSETCNASGSVFGLGILKRDGVYTTETLESE